MQETTFSFTQFYRIRNHLCGCRIEDGRDSRSRFMGSDCFSPWKCEEVGFVSRVHLLDMQLSALPKCCILLIQPTNQLHDKRCEKHSNESTKKQSNTSGDLGWTNVDYVTSNAKLSCSSALIFFHKFFKMIIKGRSPTMRHVSRTQTELRLIGYFTESTWTPKSKSTMLTPKTNLPTS